MFIYFFLVRNKFPDPIFLGFFLKPKKKYMNFLLIFHSNLYCLVFSQFTYFLFFPRGYKQNPTILHIQQLKKALLSIQTTVSLLCLENIIIKTTLRQRSKKIYYFNLDPPSLINLKIKLAHVLRKMTLQ